MEQQYAIFKNVLRKGLLLNIPYRNWVEAVIFSFFGVCLVCLIPFVKKVKITVCVIVVILIFFASLRGIKNRSITQIVIAELIFKRRRRRLHLRTPEWQKQTRQEINTNESLAESVVFRFRDGIDDFVEKYRTK